MGKLKKLPARIRQALDRLPAGDSWRANLGTAASRGYGYAWQIARADFLLEHSLCVMCRARGVVTESCIVDHIRPHRGDMALFWDRTNWQALCTTCHNVHKQRQEARNR